MVFPLSPVFFRNFFCLLVVLLLGSQTACNLPQTEGVPPSTLNVTQVYATIGAKLTQAVAQAPTLPTSQPPTPINSPPATSALQATQQHTPTLSATGSLVSLAPSATPVCDQAAAGNPIDVTIPDDTKMLPGQSFTKIWRLQNRGACAWTKDYAASFFSGEAMGAPPVVSLGEEIRPGQAVEIVVDLVAPEEPGTYQGNWKLRNASNVLFGIGPDGSAPFWVRIVVVASPTLSPAPATITPTLTLPYTPPVQSAGGLRLVPSDLVDLDSGIVNSGGGEDLSYETDMQGRHLLLPRGAVTLGVFGATLPSLAECQSTVQLSAPVIVEDLKLNDTLCYRTSQGLPGWARMTDFNAEDYTLVLEFLTWSIP